MKKLIAISILLTLITAAVFAQFKVSVTAEFQGDILRTAAALDNAGDTSKTNPIPAFTDTTTNGYSKRYFNFLSSMDYWNGSEIKLNMSYTDPDNKDDPKYGGLLQLGIDGLWVKLITKANPSLMDVVTASFGDWNFWGKVGILKGFVGNTDNRGATAGARGAHYNDYMDNFKFEPLGIMKLIAYNPYAAAGNNNLIVKHNDVDMSDLRSESVYVSVEANLAPITVAVAGDLSGIAALSDPAKNTNDSAGGIDNQNLINSHTGIGGAFRISGDVLDMVKFDAIYKITGGERTTDNQANTTNQPNGDGWWLNRIGLYGNISLFETLGITAGYSGEFIVRENNATYNNFVDPFYNGIDLRAYFNGVDKLKISFNNNFSFTTIKGSSEASTYTAGLRQTNANLNHSDKTEGYFGMYNALLVDFSLTDDLLTTFQVGNRLYVYNYTNMNADTSGTQDVTADEIQLAASAKYTLGDHVTLGTGLAFNLFHMTDLMKGRGYDIKAGLFTFGIPLTVKVVY